jgi:AcrR family transcriptional regulator
LTQQERSAATRQALLDATIDCLIELGYEKATTSEISERALLSRGAHQHHFENRAKLFAAAAEHLALRSFDELERELLLVPRGRGHVGDVLDVLWRTFDGPLYQVVVDLSVHARTDPEMRAHLEPLEQMLDKKAWPLIRDVFTEITDDAVIGSLLVMTLATIRGLVLMRVLQPSYDRKNAWNGCREQLITMIEAATAGTK